MTTLVLLSYLLGSIPFGLLLAKAFGYGDIRKIGSGSIGTTNVLRTGDKKLTALTFIARSQQHKWYWAKYKKALAVFRSIILTISN